MIEIKNRYTKEIIASGETMQDAIDKCKRSLINADLRGEDLENIDLEEGDLRGADLEYTNIEGGNLAKANLMNTNMMNTNIERANMEDANCNGANLKYVHCRNTEIETTNLDNINVNWLSRQLIAEILRRAAGKNIKKRQIAGLILVSPDWCWKKFLALDLPEKEWALDVLSQYSTENNPMPTLDGDGPKWKP